MAYVFDPNLSDEENRRRADEQSAARPASSAAGGGQPAGAQPGGAPTASGSFTNIQRYLTENQPQAKSLAQNVAGQLTQTGQDAQNAAQGVVKTANDQIDANRVPLQSDLLDEAAKNPTVVDSDAGKKAAFLKQRDADYAGPKALEDVGGFQDAQDKVKQAQARIGMTGTEAGRTQLLTDLSPAGAGKGKLALNQLLLSGNPEAGGILSDAGKPFANLGDYLTAQSTEARAKAKAAADEAAATRGNVQRRFTGDGGVVPTMAADLSGRLSGARSDAQARLDSIRTDLKGMSPSDQDLADLGISRETFSGIKGFGDLAGGQSQFDPLSFLSAQAPDAAFNIGNVATSEDYARQKALEDLMGGDIQSGIHGSDAAMAGTAPKSLATFDTQGAQAGAKTALKSYMASPISGVEVAMNTLPSVFGRPPWSDNGGMPTNLADMAGTDFYSALNGLGKLAGIMQIDATDPRIAPAYRQAYSTIQQALAPTVNSPLFQALYAAAKSARDNQAPGSQPDALINHLPPEVAAMLR